MVWVIVGVTHGQYFQPSPLPKGPLTYNGPNGPVPIPELYQAVIRKDVTRVDALLKEGADPNEMCPCGVSPLEAAVFQAKDSHITELLLANGADPNKPTPKNTKGFTNGWTPLFYAVGEKRADLVTLLLNHHSRVNVVDVQGKTPLQLARERDSPEIVQQLIKAGATH
jgi:ankyrin repeat protein